MDELCLKVPPAFSILSKYCSFFVADENVFCYWGRNVTALQAFPFFLRMLLAVMRTGRDFELVQSYLATFLKIHRAILWLSEDGDTELTNLLEELLEEEKHLWMPLDALIADNVAIIQWTKSALI